MVLSVLAPTGLAASFWARLNVVDNRWESWVFPYGSASITVKPIRMRTTFAMKKNCHLNVWNTTATPLDLSNGAFSEKPPQIFLPSLPAEYVTAFSERTDAP